MNGFERFKRRFGRIRIPNLMNLIVGGMVVVWALQMVFPALSLRSWLSLSMPLVLRGQIWRLVTFVFLPPSGSLFTLVLSLYFYWMIGTALENQWGSTRFTQYYLVGMLGSVLAALLTGSAVNTYLNLSLFFAFAATYPNFEVLLFFFLPIKMKYLALLDAVLYGWQLIVGTWPTRLTIVFSLLNLFLFVGGDLLRTLRNESRYWKTRTNFRRAMKK